MQIGHEIYFYVILVLFGNEWFFLWLDLGQVIGKCWKHYSNAIFDPIVFNLDHMLHDSWRFPYNGQVTMSTCKHQQLFLTQFISNFITSYILIDHSLLCFHSLKIKITKECRQTIFNTISQFISVSMFCSDEFWQRNTLKLKTVSILNLSVWCCGRINQSIRFLVYVFVNRCK